MIALTRDSGAWRLPGMDDRPDCIGADRRVRRPGHVNSQLEESSQWWALAEVVNWRRVDGCLPSFRPPGMWLAAVECPKFVARRFKAF